MAENQSGGHPDEEKRKRAGAANLTVRMSLGIILGTAFGIAFNQLALGISLGLLAGIYYDRIRTRRDRAAQNEKNGGTKNS